MGASRIAIEEIRNRISSGLYARHSKLPRETELAAEIGVSRGALREAIRALELTGVLRTKHGSGTYVTALNPSDLLGQLTHGDGFLGVESAVELAEFRRIVEPAGTALAAERATAEEAAVVRQLYEEMEMVDDPVKYAHLDSRFHQAILAASGNSFIVGVSAGLTNGRAWQSMWDAVTRDSVPDRTRREHENLVRALESRDRELALATAHAHISEAQAHIVELVRTAQQNPEMPVSQGEQE
ncbi:FCD domain-containing protein [Mycobacterium sp. 21AC1]|uniref:FadR/GntR family transcriptional regulator n=1 Tax=[Mycobacterium] appelbergii TaxID=2939269 RepID=UPI00293912A7|nr:FCD domain-containing protein [Mycobacterium sp. 21AC1]MDV3128049.1 FCD domain-containing protein [Mycobacterium sp. 21AC1]